ncbi:MAG: 8-amino-7-oxononanoate synthase [bacterium]
MNFIADLLQDTDDLKSNGRFRLLREIVPLGDGRCRWEGKEYSNLSSNDYLGIAGNAELRRSFYGQFDLGSPELALTSASSRLLTGNTLAYTRLENKLSELYDQRAALVFNSGYHANIGILPALASNKDLVLSDKLNHASIIDGLKLCDAETQRYRHLDYEHLEKILSEKRAQYRQVFLVTESVFSMDGDSADILKLVALKEKYDCLLVVDEAHTVGVRGPSGAGMCAALGVQQKVDILIGTFGKAFASAGAYAVMAAEVKDYLINHARSFIFTTGLPPAVLNWSAFVLKRCSRMDAEREKLTRMGIRLRALIQAKGQGVTIEGDSQIVPLIIGEDADAVAKASDYQEKGFLVFAIRPPTVPLGTSRLRFSLNAALDESILDNLV